MAGGSSKREAAARKAAAMTWGGVAAGLTLLALVVQYFTGGSIVSWGEAAHLGPALRQQPSQRVLPMR